VPGGVVGHAKFLSQVSHETEIAVAHQTKRRSNFELLQSLADGFVDAHCGPSYPNGYGMSTKKMSATGFLDPTFFYQSL
jgi:hypothetical protein